MIFLQEKFSRFLNQLIAWNSLNCILMTHIKFSNSVISQKIFRQIKFASNLSQFFTKSIINRFQRQDNFWKIIFWNFSLQIQFKVLNDNPQKNTLRLRLIYASRDHSRSRRARENSKPNKIWIIDFAEKTLLMNI